MKKKNFKKSFHKFIEKIFKINKNIKTGENIYRAGSTLLLPFGLD